MFAYVWDMIADLTRRTLLIGGGAALLPLPAIGRAQAISGSEFGLVGDSVDDQTAAVQEAILAAQQRGEPLLLPTGTFYVRGLDIPGGSRLIGVPGTTLAALGGGPVARIAGQRGVRIESVGFVGGAASVPYGSLLEIADSEDVQLLGCSIVDSAGSGVTLLRAAATIHNCTITGHGQDGIMSLDSMGLHIYGNRVGKCGNGGIRIWRSEAGSDGSIITGNAIEAIDWTNGGNGQNGNGINVFRAGAVIISDNRIDACTFSAVRLNATNDCVVRGNVCTESGECAIFSEFGFSGSIVSNNVVDGAVTGISITNFDQGGRLAVCSGNLVRNIRPVSDTNPDAGPTGIHAEADTLVNGNVVESVPVGKGISVGWGPFLRDVIASDNIVREAQLGIGVSVAPGAGRAVISGNLVTGGAAGIAGMAWDDVMTRDLQADAARYPNVTISGNTTG